MKRNTITYLFMSVFLSTNVHAFHYLNWGIAEDYPGGGSYSDVQTYSFGVQEPMWKTLDLFAELGGWKDEGHYPGAQPGVFLAIGPALNLRMHEHYAQYSLGIAGIAPADSLLGSNIQVYHKLSIGFQQDGTNKRIGVGVKHLSDAGLGPGKNYGRNFVFLEVSI